MTSLFMTTQQNKIPIPASRKWREIRVRIIPFLVFFLIAGVVAWLWKDRVEATQMIGHVVGKQTEIRSPQPGSIADFRINTFDNVSAGEPIGQLVTTDPDILESELAIILAEIELLRLTADPVADQQRNLLNFESLQIDLMENRARLGIARIRKKAAGRHLQRITQLKERDMATEEELLTAETEYHTLKEEIAITEELVERLAGRIDDLDMDKVIALWKESDPRAAAINVQKRTIDNIVAQMKPMVLRAPASGQVAHIYRHNGEFVGRGEIIARIYSETPDYILGYLRHPVHTMPEPGMKVAVNKQNRKRDEAIMVIEKVGVQMEKLEEETGLFRDRPFQTTGLPVRIAINHELGLLPGESVDIRLLSN